MNIRLFLLASINLAHLPVTNIAIRDNIILALLHILAVGFDTCFITSFFQIIKLHDFTHDKGLFKVGVNDTGSYEQSSAKC